MEPRISLITLGVSDLERSRAFYRDGLGFTLRPESQDGIAFFALHGLWLALYPRDALAEDAHLPPSPAVTGAFPGFTLAHNLRTRVEVDEVLAHAVKAGATLVKPAADVFWGGYSGYFADPDGFLWEVAHNPFVWIE